MLKKSNMQDKKKAKSKEKTSEETSLEMRSYVTALEAENEKLHRQIGKLKAENLSLNNRLKVQAEEHDKYVIDHPTYEITSEKLAELKRQRQELNEPLSKNGKE